MQSTNTFFTTAAYRLYIAGLFLVPTAVVVSYTVPMQPTKMLIAAVALIGALALAVLGAFKRGGLSIPRSAIMGAVWLLPIAYLISASLAPHFEWSLIGGGLDHDTVFFMALVALAVSLPLYIFNGKKDFVRALFAILIAAWVIGLFHLARLFFGAEFLSFDLFTNPLFSPLGKWNDVSIFFGLISLMTLVTLESLPMEGTPKWVLTATLVASLFLVAVVNFVPVWVSLAVISLGVVLYRYLLVRGQAKFSAAATVVFVVSVVAIIFSSTWGASLGTTFGVEQIEARPSWESTLAVGTAALKESPLVGTGPNNFLLAWDAYRPALINQSVFWNADFASGVGYIPTSVISTGLVGALAWILLFIALIAAGIKGLLLRAPEEGSHFHLIMATFVGAIFILVMAFVYLPSPQLLLLGAALLGMFAALAHDEYGKTTQLEFKEKPRIGFVAVLLLALALVVSVVSVYGTGTVFASDVYYERAARSAQVDGNIEAARENIDAAIAQYPEDRYYRLKSLVHVAELNALLSNPGAAEDSASQEKFQSSLGAAVESGLRATALNDKNYRNWQGLATAYQTVVPLNIEGAYEAALGALDRAAALNPTIPTIPFTRAQIELVKENSKAAKEAVLMAVKLKEDHIPSLLMLAQLELADGNLKEAIRRADAAALFEPSNPVTRFQVGVLKFEDKDYVGATQAFAEALAIAPDYANAHYYLGRVQLVAGEHEAAQKSFEEVLRLNPGNQEVVGIIEAIQAGEDPFAPDGRGE